MAYFPHAYKKVFVPLGTFGPGLATHELQPGDFGFYAASTWLPKAQESAEPSMLVMGSYYPVDKIGSHGGYKESQKSPVIDPRQIRRFWKVTGRAPVNQIITAGYSQAVAGSAPAFDKGKQYLLRVDLKGSPALRFMQRNLYRTFDAASGCVDTCVDPCAPAAKIDPVVILLQWAKQINGDPIFSNFIRAEVYTENATNVLVNVNPDTYQAKTVPEEIALVKAGMRLIVAYADTRFGDCSFDPREHYELEPLLILASIVDENGNPCNIPELVIHEQQAPVAAQGTGETILRDLILSNRYRQEPYQHKPRRREIEHIDATTHAVVSRDPLTIYDSYYLLFSVPRHSNPTSTQDNDQYLLQISLPQTFDASDFIQYVHNFITNAGGTVVLETFS